MQWEKANPQTLWYEPNRTHPPRGCPQSPQKEEYPSPYERRQERKQNPSNAPQTNEMHM
jgi:hypothetical protein